MDIDELTARALAWLGIPLAQAGPDTEEAGHVAAAVHAWVSGLPATARRAAGGPWRDDTEHGAVMLTARLIRRRNTPNGIESFTADSAAYVSRTDPDIAPLLGIGAHTYPAIG